MTPTEIHEARLKLGLTQAQLGLALGLTGDPSRTVRKWEAGERAIPGPVAVLMRAFLSGYRPEGWPKISSAN